jgi:hypothetical protein
MHKNFEIFRDNFSTTGKDIYTENIDERKKDQNKNAGNF